MKPIFTYIIFTIAIIIGFVNCGSQSSTFAYYNSEPECLECEGDGSETILTWGKGKNKSDAMEQAKKNAVSVVLFSGIHRGNKSCSNKPLITEVNAREKHEEYFNAFFKDGGKYKSFVSNADKKRDSEIKSHNKQEDKYGFVVRVKRAELKEQLIEDKIIIQ